MSDLSTRIDEAMEVHFSRFIAYEIKEDFPVLRLQKSTNAYRIIATFQTIPVSKRMEVGRALVPSLRPKSEKQELLWESFYRRMNANTLAELNAMSFDSSELELELSSSYELHAGDEFMTAMRAHLEKLSRSEIKKRFVARLKEKYESSLKAIRGGAVYEVKTALRDWELTTQVDFSGYQFNCHFELRHAQLERELWFAPGSFFGFGDVLGWDDVSRDTLDQDAEQAAQLCLRIRQFLFNIASDVG